MLTTSHLQTHLADLFTLAYRGGISLKVGYKKRVYILTIQLTGEEYVPSEYLKLRRRERAKKRRKGNVALNVIDCATCGFSEVAGICINKKCPSYHAGASA